MVIGSAQSFRSEAETVTEPYWSIGGPANYQLNMGTHSTSILATDLLRHRTLIKGTLRHAVITAQVFGDTNSYYLGTIGMSLLLSPADFKNRLANAGEPFLPPNDAELRFEVKHAGKMLEYSNFIGIRSVLDTNQGQYAFETIDFWARNMVDKSIK